MSPYTSTYGQTSLKYRTLVEYRMATNLPESGLRAKLSGHLHTLAHQAKKLNVRPTFNQSRNIIARLDDIIARLDTINDRLDTMNDRLDTMNKRLDTMNKQLDTMDKRIDNPDSRLNNLDQKLDTVNLNNITQVENSDLGHQNNSVINSLRNFRTGQAIPNFPTNPAQIDTMNMATIDSILVSLGSHAGGTPTDRRRRLKVDIGLRLVEA